MTLNLSDKKSIAIRHFYSQPTLGQIDALIDKATAGGAEDKFALGKKMLELINSYMAPDDVQVYRDALALFEEAGEAGYVEAMEYTVRLHASGLPHQLIVEEGNSITAYSQPDWQKAYDWCVKAKEAGGAWATQILPRLSADKAAAEKKAAAQQSSSVPRISPPG